ncbi:MAG: glycosyltransferase family 4 protein [Planctomycetota bacterium]
MRILHVITRLILGGAQQNTVMSCAAQAKAGHDVHLAFGPIHGPEGSLLDEAKQSGATLHELPTLVRELAPLTDYRAYRALRKLIRDLKPDVVHTHSSKAGILGRAAAYSQRWMSDRMRDGKSFDDTLRGAPDHLKRRVAIKGDIGIDQVFRPVVIHTVHGLPFHDGNSWLKNRLYIALEAYAAHRCDHLIAIAPQMVEAFALHDIATSADFSVIPSGIDHRYFIDQANATTVPNAKAMLGLPSDAPTVGLIARLDPYKGHRDLIAAAPAILDRVPGARLVFLGDGYDRPAIEQAVADSPHADRFVFKGLVPWRDMPAAYKACDVVTLPSKQEGQSRVLAEALCCGCPIVATDVGGIPSICIDRQTGRLVPPGDVPALAKAIADQLTDRDTAQRMTAAGQQLIAEQFSAEKMNRDLLALYERLIDGT